MKFLKFLLLSLIFNGLLQAAVAVDQFPMSDKITMYFSTDVESRSINDIQKQTENAASLVQQLLESKPENADLRAAIIMAINNALFDKLTVENKKLSAIQKINIAVVITPEIESLLGQCVETLFYFQPKENSKDLFIERVNNIIQENKKETQVFAALNSYFNIYENIIYDICRMSTLNSSTILDMRNRVNEYALKFISSRQATIISSQDGISKRYLVAISQLIEQPATTKLEEQIKSALKDYTLNDTVTLYFNTDYEQKEDGLKFITPNNLIKKLDANNLRSQIVNVINGILVSQEKIFSQAIKNGLPSKKMHKTTASFIKAIKQEADKNDLLKQILDDDSFNIAALNDVLTGETKDTLMPQVLDVNKALSILERIVFVIYKQLEDKSSYDYIVESLFDNQLEIKQLIIAQSGLGELTGEVKTLVDKLSEFYFSNFSNELKNKELRVEQGLDVLEVNANEAAEAKKREEKAKQAAANAAEVEAKIHTGALDALEQDQKKENAKLTKAQTTSENIPLIPAPINNSQTQILPQTQIPRPTPAPRPPKISTDILINLTTILSALQPETGE